MRTEKNNPETIGLSLRKTFQTMQVSNTSSVLHDDQDIKEQDQKPKLFRARHCLETEALHH